MPTETLFHGTKNNYCMKLPPAWDGMKIGGDYMADYIKREDAIEAFDPRQRQDWYTPWIVETLKDLPSADVAPVRHGRWDVREPMPMHDIKGNLSWGNWYVCTGCGFATTAIEGHITQYKYCPSCGARMDGEENV